MGTYFRHTLVWQQVLAMRVPGGHWAVRVDGLYILSFLFASLYLSLPLYYIHPET